MGRRQITTAVTMLVLCGILAAGAVWGWQSLFADVPEDTGLLAAKPSPSCTKQRVDVGQRVNVRQVRVSVYNGGSRSGLASRTMAKLTGRGFKSGQVGNAPSNVRVRRVQVWTTAKNDVEARLVARQFGKRTKVRVVGADLGPGVDVIVGDKFKGLKKAPASLKAEGTQQVCVPLDTAGTASS